MPLEVRQAWRSPALPARRGERGDRLNAGMAGIRGIEWPGRSVAAGALSKDQTAKARGTTGLRRRLENRAPACPGCMTGGQPRGVRVTWTWYRPGCRRPGRETGRKVVRQFPAKDSGIRIFMQFGSLFSEIVTKRDVWD